MQKLIFNKKKIKVLRIFKNNQESKEPFRIVKNILQVLK